MLVTSTPQHSGTSALRHLGTIFSPPMPLHTFRAIILRGYETGDTSEALHTFSGEFGRLSLMARGLRSPKSKWSGVLQPLSTVELSVALREGGDMATLREAATINDRAAIRADLERLGLACLLAELAAESADTAQPAPDLFDALEHHLAPLEPASGHPPASTAALGMLAILAAAGYEIALDDELQRPWPRDLAKPRAFWLELAAGVVRHRREADPPIVKWPWAMAAAAPDWPLPPEAVRAIHTFNQSVADEATVIASLSPTHAAQLIEGLARMAEYHLGVRLRAAKFWRSMA